MKRAMNIALFVSLAVLIQAAGSTVAQEEQTAAKPVESRKEAKAAAWMTVAPGIKVIRLWETSAGPRWPEIAILLLTADRHQQLEQNPLAFVREHRIFEKVDGVRGHSVIKLYEERGPSGDDGYRYVTMMPHDKTTYFGYSSYETQIE